MYSVLVVPNQSWTDLAVQCYGNVDAVFALLDDNAPDAEVDIANACSLPYVLVREDDALKNPYVLANMPGAIIATLK